MAEEDTEITLGMGKLLGLFFMLALTCGIFFAVGYSFGKTAEREQALKNQPSQTLSGDRDVATSKTQGTSVSGSKAAPGNDNESDGDETAPNLTFYNAVKQTPGEESKSEPALKSAEANPSSASANTVAAKQREMAVSAKPAPVAKLERPASAASTPTASPSGTFLVQIAAVTHEEDAAALAGALRKKSYVASVVNNPTGKDKLYHVVLGPYASLQDAEAMKAKLQGEGYSPIVKR